MKYLLGETFRTQDLEISVLKVPNEDLPCTGCFLQFRSITFCENFITKYSDGFCDGVIFDKNIYK